MDVFHKCFLILLGFNFCNNFHRVDGTKVMGKGTCYIMNSCRKGETAVPPCEAKIIKGDSGEDGMNGFLGLPGLKGDPGHIGLPGGMGTNAMCNCSTIDVAGESKENIYESCKFAKYNYTISPAEKKGFDVQCDNSKVCINYNRTKPISVPLRDQNKPFWLSEKKTNVLYDIPEFNITALQSVYSNVRQNIKFLCKNMHIFYNGKDNSSTVEFWTWNDLHIKPFSTASTPRNYNISIIEDNCKDETNVSELYKSSKIEIMSSVTNLLPVRDIYIKDVRKEYQELFIQIGDLCFF